MEEASVGPLKANGPTASPVATFRPAFQMGVVCALGLLLVVVVGLRFAQPIEDGDLFWHMPVNWLLERGMEVDRQLINAGWTLPFGGSLLVAARRRDG